MSKHAQVFDGLSSSEVQTVLEFGVLQEYPTGEVLFQKGSRSSNMFVVVEGEVRIFVQMHGIEIDLAKLGKGDVFGEMAAVTQSPRTANAQVNKPSTLFVFDHDALARLDEEAPDITRRLYFNLLHITAQRLAETNRRLVADRVESLEASFL